MGNPLHAFFARIPLFSALGVEDLEDIIRAVRPVSLADGATLFSEGEPGDAAYVVESGLLRVFRRIDDREIELARVGTHEVIGELALIDGALRSATVVALDACTLYRLDKAEFDFLRRNFRPAAFSVIRNISATICARIRETNGLVADLLSDAPGAIPPPDGRPESTVGWLKRMFGGKR